MRNTAVLAAIGLVAAMVTSDGWAASKDKDKEKDSAGHAATGAAMDSTPASGRFQLVVVPGHPGSPFLLDTSSGCVWHQVQHQETKRTTFVEVDIENLHWSWGSGSLQMLASRIDGATGLNDQQKRVLKESLQKTACGSTNVVLTPGVGPAQPTSAPAPSQPNQ